MDRVAVITDHVLTFWVALNIPKLYPPSIRLPVLKAFDSVKDTGVIKISPCPRLLVPKGL